MQPADLINYIEDPKRLDKQSVGELQKLVSEFPYFQSAHLLLSMASKKWDASVYQQSLKKTAIVATNRTHLFNLIHQVEQAGSENDHGTKVETDTPVKNIEAPSTEQKASSREEIDILKAAEISAKPVHKELRPSGEEELEKEIAKQLVVSFVEKEILKTPELHDPTPVEDSPENFGDWLIFLKKNNGQSYKQIVQDVKDEKIKQKAKQAASEDVQVERKQKNKALIDKIIESSPGLIRVKEDQKFYTPDQKAKESLLENEHLVTETLAKIYALQGNVNKAIRAYEILSLKFPQKSAYFATLIQKLKNN